MTAMCRPAKTCPMGCRLGSMFALLLLGLEALGGCGGPTERCDEWRNAPCPPGQLNAVRNDPFCEGRYQSDCAEEFAELIDCGIASPTCDIQNGDGTQQIVPNHTCDAKNTRYWACKCEGDSRYCPEPH